MTKEEERTATEFLYMSSMCKDENHDDDNALFSEYGETHKTISAARKELVHEKILQVEDLSLLSVSCTRR